MRIRRQLFLLQAATLGIITAGSIGGWGLSRWIGHGPRQEAERLDVELSHLAHMSFDLVGAVPHTGQYLLSSPDKLTELLQRDIDGLRRFREELDEHLASLTLVSADPQLHRELETIRLLSVQLEQNLSDVEREAQEARRKGLPPDAAAVEKAVRDPSIGLIRRHSDLLAGLHDSLDARHDRMVSIQSQAVRLGVISWISVLLAAWVIGLLLAWRMGDRLLNPLVQLERVMRRPPQQMGDELLDPIFQQAPEEIGSLSRSFQTLVLEVKQLLAQLEDQLRTDGLTAVGNRRHFDTTLGQEWNRGLRSGEPLSLLLLDVDHFKQYNDCYGHIEGDRCLQQVALAIRGQARRSSDVVCRIGGEEFAVLLPATAQAEAAGVARGIVRAIDRLAIEHAGSAVAAWVTVSIGVASCTPSSQGNPTDLMERADGALYVRKKRQGRHGICLADAVVEELPTPTPLS